MSSFKKIYIIAGEDSGDLHGSNLIKALNNKSPNLEFKGVGGDLMAEQGVPLTAHIKDINFMGFWEIIKNLRTIRQLFANVKADISLWKPDAVILIDYPGFNLRMAKYLHQLGIKVIFYISPQVWAWKKGRVKQIKAYVDKMMVILPFEKEFYAKEGVEVDFVGHPLLDVIEDKDHASQAPIVAILPGSRKQEIKRMLPTMLEMIPHFPEYKFVIAGAPSREASFYEEMIGEKPVELWMNRTYELLAKASYAMVTSGTATLETALHQVPEVVCYRGAAISYEIGKRLVKVKFISLVNLILNKEAVKELIQYDFTAPKLKAALENLMGEETRNQLKEDYILLRKMLGNAGASQRAADQVLQVLELPIAQKP